MIKLRYGKGEVEADLSGFRAVRVFSPPTADTKVPVETLVSKALKEPVESPSLREVARGKRPVVISIPDKTRPRIAAKLLPPVIDELARAGVDLSDIALFVANGTHSLHTGADFVDLVGRDIAGKLRIHQNDCRRLEDFDRLGVTSRGTPVLINKIVARADLNIAIGGVASHYFAGMGGGRKAYLPGAAHVETAWANHRLTLKDDGGFHPACRTGRVEGNPVHEDMVEALGLMGDVFLVNAILDGWAEVSAVNAGHPVRSHLEAVRGARRLLEVRPGEKCDFAVVSGGGHPLDVNFIQSHKSIDHAAAALRDGGLMAVAAECAEGAGSNTFMQWFEHGDTRELSRKLLSDYELNGHTALSLAMKLERVGIIMVSSFSRAVVEKMGMTYAQDMRQAIAKARAALGPDASTYVFPCAWGIMPVA